MLYQRKLGYNFFPEILLFMFISLDTVGSSDYVESIDYVNENEK
jgi:hypothetical protein